MLYRYALAAASAAVVAAAPAAPAAASPPAPLINPADVPVNEFTYSVANGAPYLNNLAQAAGKLWLGTAADVPGVEQQDKEYMTILNDTRIFGQITPANDMKWQFTEPQRNNFSYSGGDVSVNIAEDHGKYLRCHNLCWDNENPQWLLDLVSAGVSNKTMVNILQNHIANVVGHWGGRCFSWDVVNEALNGTGGWDAANPFYQVIGPAFFPIAFQAAEKAVKKTRAPIQLVYNDYGIETAGPRGSGALRILGDLKNRGIQVDGVGFESHFEVGGSPSIPQLMEQMNAFIALDLDVYITELDIRFVNVTTQTTAGGFAQQALDYYNVVSACMQVDRCKGITVWDFVDKYSCKYTFPCNFTTQLIFNFRDPLYLRWPG